jgi:hypothetical protein
MFIRHGIDIIPRSAVDISSDVGLDVEALAESGSDAVLPWSIRKKQSINEQ